MKSSELIKPFSIAALLLAPLVGHAQITSGQSFRLATACDTTKVMQISSSSLMDNAKVVLQALNTSTSSAGNAQVFKFETYSSGYKITNQNSGKTLNIANASTASKAALEQYKFTGVPSEVFKISTTSDGYYRLQNVNSSLYVNLINGSTTLGAGFEQYSDTPTACAEKFKLIAVGSTSPSPTPTTTTLAPATTTTLAPVTTTTLPAPTSGSRDPMVQPFASSSIWNMPLGSSAVYKPANLSGNPGANIWAAMPGADEEHILMTPTAPMTTINYSSVGWSGGDRCAATGGLLVQIPMPSSYVIPNNNRNTAVSSLLSDKRSIIQLQPVARCTAGGPGTALVKFNAVDLYGDGRLGAHGGSGLSSIGGSIRLGELRPSSPTGPKHALKVNVYAKEALYRCSVRSDCSRWPAANSDSYAVGWYGSANNNSNVDMKMGALLAIPPSVNIANLGLETAPAKQLAWTLQNYGAYIVDDAYAPGFDISIETGPNGSKAAQFQSDWGYPFASRVNNASTSAWTRDIQRLVQALYVVSNSSSTTIGGGGTPRQPLAAPIAP